MKIDHIENGDMVVSHKSWFWLVVLLNLLLVNFAAGGYVMATNPISSWWPNIYIQLPILAVLGFLLGRAFTRKSEFYFDRKTNTVNYVVQSFWAEEAGAVSISDIVEVITQEGGTNDSGSPLERLAIVCKRKKIPMSLTYTNTVDFDSIKNEIDKWLLEEG